MWIFLFKEWNSFNPCNHQLLQEAEQKWGHNTPHMSKLRMWNGKHKPFISFGYSTNMKHACNRKCKYSESLLINSTEQLPKGDNVTCRLSIRRIAYAWPSDDEIPLNIIVRTPKAELGISSSRFISSRGYREWNRCTISGKSTISCSGSSCHPNYK